MRADTTGATMAATVPLTLVPTYQYECTECGAALEVHQSFSDDPLTTCSICSGRLRKVYNAVGVVFKGSGFYRTDSRKADSKVSTDSPAAKPEKSEKSSSSTSSSSTSTPAKATASD